MAKKSTADKQVTRFAGVYQRASTKRRFQGKPDVCFSIDYFDPHTGQRRRKTIGWRSQGFTAEYANSVRTGLLAQARKDQFAGVAPLDDKDIPTFGQAWEMYRQDWLEARNKPVATDQGFFSNHLGEIANRRLNTISAYELQKLANDLVRKGYAPQTAKHVLAFVRRVMRKMMAWKRWHGPLPFGDIEMPKVSNERARYLTPYEARALLESLHGICPRAWIMSLISLHCGLRLGEIKKLRHGDVDFESGVISIRDTKNTKDRYAVMTQAVRNALADLPKGRSASLLFPSKRGTVIKKKDDLFDEVIAAWEFNEGVTDNRDKVVFHTLRHTYASWLASEGSGQAEIADLLGHSSLQMSKRYTHLMKGARWQAAENIEAKFSGREHQEPRR